MLHRLARLTPAVLLTGTLFVAACSTAPEPKPAPKPAATATTSEPMRVDGVACTTCKVVLCLGSQNRIERVDISVQLDASPRTRFDEATLQLTSKSGQMQVVPLKTGLWRPGKLHQERLKDPKLGPARGGWKTEGALTVSWEDKGKSHGAKLVTEVEAKSCR